MPRLRAFLKLLGDEGEPPLGHPRHPWSMVSE